MPAHCQIRTTSTSAPPLKLAESQGFDWHAVEDDAKENQTDGAEIPSEMHHAGSGAETRSLPWMEVVSRFTCDRGSSALGRATRSRQRQRRRMERDLLWPQAFPTLAATHFGREQFALFFPLFRSKFRSFFSLSGGLLVELWPRFKGMHHPSAHIGRSRENVERHLQQKKEKPSEILGGPGGEVQRRSGPEVNEGPKTRKNTKGSTVA